MSSSADSPAITPTALEPKESKWPLPIWLIALIVLIITGLVVMWLRRGNNDGVTDKPIEDEGVEGEETEPESDDE